MVGYVVALDDIIGQVRSYRILGGDADEIEEIVPRVLEHNPNWNCISLNVALNGETEERVFSSLVSSNRIECLILAPNVAFESTEVMLRKAVTSLPNLVGVTFASALTEPQVEKILSILQLSVSLKQVTFFLGVCGDGLAKPFRKCLKEASWSLETLAFTWESNLETVVPLPMSQSSFSSLCDGIGECQSLKHIILDTPPSDDTLASSLAFAVAKSFSMEKVLFPLSHQTFMAMFRNTLTRLQAVQNFDLCFSVYEESSLAILTLDRNPPWKPLLSENIPLALWSRILAKTNAWNRRIISHSKVDALYFLMREKNDVLLQNVRRRKIRKRKRFQMS